MVLNLDFLTSDDAPATTNVDIGSRDGELCLRFDVPSGNEFALAASGVREVMSVYPDRITPIPNASPFFLGTYNWRGQVIWIADLGQFLGDQILVNTDRTEVSLLIVEEQELVMGFAVRTVINTEWLNIDRVSAPQGGRVSSPQGGRIVSGDLDIPTAMQGFVKGIYSTTGSDIPELRLLDRVAIIRSTHWAT
jgi:purine-binding chemotaxis protein CheW